MTRHIELTLDNFDLTCWGEAEDFENDTKEYIEEHVCDYIYHSVADLLPYIKIKQIWYEED